MSSVDDLKTKFLPNCKCGKPAQEPHSCPYQSDINYNDDPQYCNCCGDCMADCKDDI